jgi:hypothetical protein
MDCQYAFFDKRFRPHRRKQFALPNQPPPVSNQNHQYVVRFRCQPDDLAVLRQSPLANVEREFTELVDFPSGHWSNRIEPLSET